MQKTLNILHGLSEGILPDTHRSKTEIRKIFRRRFVDEGSTPKEAYQKTEKLIKIAGL